MYAHTTADIRTSGGGGGPIYDPVTTIILNADGSYALPAGLLAFITITNAAGLASLNIGKTPGGSEYVNSEPIDAGVPETFSIGEKFTAGATIYFTSITSATTISFYKF